MVVGQIRADQEITLLHAESKVLDMTQVVQLHGHQPTTLKVHTYERVYVTVCLNYPGKRVRKPREFRAAETSDLAGYVVIEIDTSDLKTKPVTVTVIVKNDRHPERSGTFILPCAVRA